MCFKREQNRTTFDLKKDDKIGKKIFTNKNTKLEVQIRNFQALVLVSENSFLVLQYQYLNTKNHFDISIPLFDTKNQ